MKLKRLFAVGMAALAAVCGSASAGIIIDAGEVYIDSQPDPVVFTFPVFITLDGGTGPLNVRSFDFKLRFSYLPDNVLRTAPSPNAAAVPAPDDGGAGFSYTVNPVQGTYIRSGPGLSINGFGQTISSSSATGFTVPQNGTKKLVNFNFELAAFTRLGVYVVDVIPSDQGVLSIGTDADEFLFPDSVSVAQGFIRVNPYIIPEPASLGLLAPAALLMGRRRR